MQYIDLGLGLGFYDVSLALAWPWRYACSLVLCGLVNIPAVWCYVEPYKNVA